MRNMQWRFLKMKNRYSSWHNWLMAQDGKYIGTIIGKIAYPIQSVIQGHRVVHGITVDYNPTH